MKRNGLETDSSFSKHRYFTRLIVNYGAWKARLSESAWTNFDCFIDPNRGSARFLGTVAFQLFEYQNNVPNDSTKVMDRKCGCLAIRGLRIQKTQTFMNPLRRLLLVSLALFSYGFCLPIWEKAHSMDWPMYRNDSGRRGVTEDQLPGNLSLSWVRTFPGLSPAFKDKRLHFDAGYEPVVARGLVLIASSLTDSVKAYNTLTGEQRWSFYTDGPVRFAPAISGNRACFGSDDGSMYCVELDTGKLIWKQRAAPSGRRLLGNRRLISVWPIRGGPVVADGRVYFAAGVWPFEGVFVYAMDIETGKVLWRNDRLGYLWGDQPHNTKAIGGVAPQGYLLVNDHELIVPCSTAYPARLNRATGDLIAFDLPKPGKYPGGWFASLDPDDARAIRRGKLTFDEVINRHEHEGKVQFSSGGVEGLSREIRSAKKVLKFDEPYPGVDGTIHSMVVADAALFVTTRDGRLLCFRETDRTNHKAPIVRNRRTIPPEIPKSALKAAAAIVEESASRYGIAMVIGLVDGYLTKALIESSYFHVIVFDDDKARIQKLRREFDEAGWSGDRAAVIHSNLQDLELPPYITTVLVSERSDVSVDSLLQTLRPFGGIAVGGQGSEDLLKTLKPGGFSMQTTQISGDPWVRREGPLPGSSEYKGDFSTSKDSLVKFPLGVLWFDDSLAHFKRSPQPVFDRDTMISRPKNWGVPRFEEHNKIDYPLLSPVLSDIYTGRILEESERQDLRNRLEPSSPKVLEPSQYRLPGQPFSTKPGPVLVGERINPLTGESEPRSIPKTYGCDGGVDYGSLFTLRSGTAAFYDKTIESGTVFLSGPRSGCTNSLIPTGGLLNVPYYYDGCTCSYPLPAALSLVAMPESHEQWSSWGESEIEPGKIQRIGINFGAPGDRMTRDGTLWLDYPSIGGPSPKVNIEVTLDTRFRYQHSMWIRDSGPFPWVYASMAEQLKRCVIKDLKPGKYVVRLYFMEPGLVGANQRSQDISLQGELVTDNFDVLTASGGVMKGTVKEFRNIEVRNELVVELFARRGNTVISGIELLSDE